VQRLLQFLAEMRMMVDRLDQVGQLLSAQSSLKYCTVSDNSGIKALELLVRLPLN
jgi:hypothetical protein